MSKVIYTHARVLTCDAAFSRAQAVVVENGKIVAVGSHDDLLSLADAHSRVINLNGATLLPGFNDAHCHALSFGLSLDSVLLSTPPVGNIPDIVAQLQKRADETTGNGEFWLRGRGYDQNKLDEKRHPTRRELDKAAGGEAFIILTQTSGHAVTVNSRVLQKAGITRETPDPPGGTIVRDADGEPTGVLLENAMGLAHAVAPARTHGDKVAALGKASRALHALGITSATEASTGLDDLAVFRDAAQSGELTARCALMMLIEQLADGKRTRTPEELRDGIESDFVHVGPAKLFSDGALTTRTALLRASYADDELNLGTAMWETERLETMVGDAHAAGWQIASHAIGDAAIDVCLDAYGKALRARPRADARHRIEHAMLLWPDQVDRMARLGVLPVYQPEFIAWLGDAYIAGLGRKRANRLMPYTSTQAVGLPLIFSSDLPVVPGPPLIGIASAVTRRTPNGEILDARHCVSVPDALRAYTSGGAFSFFQEGVKGELVPGQCADFVILSADPTTLPPDEWADGVQVQATLVGGNVVFGEM